MDLQKHFTEVSDFRVKGRCLHELSDILLILLLGTLADCSDFSEIEDYAKDKEVFLREKVGLLLLSGIPSQDTLRRVVRFLKPAELEKSLRSACKEMLKTMEQKHIRIDGKEMRGTIPFGKKDATVQVVSAWISEESISFGQVQIAEKSSETTAIPRLIEELDCEGGIITIDAIACQKVIVEKIIEKKADYIIALKANQGSLFQQMNDYVEKNKPQLPSYHQLNKDHGRGEKRVVYIAERADYLDTTDGWKNVNTIILVESTRLVDNKESTSKRIYISSLTSKSPERYAHLIRGHWGIENGLHWQLDLTFREDDSRVRKDNGPMNLNIFRKFSLFLLKHEPSKISLKRKRKKAARDDGFMMEVLKVPNLVQQPYLRRAWAERADIWAHRPSPTDLPASRRNDQWLYPSGAVLQAKAMSLARSRAWMTRGRPLRGWSESIANPLAATIGCNHWLQIGCKLGGPLRHRTLTHLQVPGHGAVALTLS